MSKYTEAAKQADWQQVIFNGGPPCFHLEEDGSFCLRAERWAGHKATPGFHGFVSLAALIAELEAEVDGLQKRIGNEFMKRAEHHFVEKDRENALLRKALEAARDAMAAFAKPAGFLPDQNAFATKMTDAEMHLSQAIADLDLIISGATLARIPEAKW